MDRSVVLPVALSAGAAVLGTFLTHKLLESHEANMRFKNAKEERDRRQEAKEKGKEGGDDVPKGMLLEDVGIPNVYLWEVEHLGALGFPSSYKGVNKMRNNQAYSEYTADTKSKAGSDYNKLISDRECIIADIRQGPGSKSTRAYVRAGPREHLHFNPSTTVAAIVTCGGLCPGLNNVIRELTNTLHYLYGVKKVLGVKGGYAGFYNPEWEPIVLTPESVANIHHDGGTFLGSSRGGFEMDGTIAFLEKHKVNQLFVIGGDGTHRGAFKIHEECMKRKINIGVCGIPKTIDNDVDHIDRSFGFSSAVQAAQSAIRTAKTEAMCNLPNGIGIVKLMGRSAGFVAVHAAMSSGDVDLCLVPEVPIVLEGEKGCLPHLLRRVREQGYAVVVVAEGAGEELLGESTETDASGNKKLPKIGEYLKEKIGEYFKVHSKEPATVKYVDPSYMIRSCPANAADSLYCMQLAQNAVHGIMAGYTGFSVGLCNNRMVLLPIPELCESSPRTMDAHGRTWERVLSITRQPNTAGPKPKGNKAKYAPMLR
mmetsp:Transcript_20919/g.43660  ORF Transcript_20919/g.43660 Transcript_20919/m.43660 type:complete len:538 (+) Transcript_20919:35-1648(+)